MIFDGHDKTGWHTDEFGWSAPSYPVILESDPMGVPVSTVTSSDGTIIDYDRCGRGPTVVFIAGAAQYRATDPRTTAIAERLAGAGFTTVVFDRRGRGPSGNTEPWAIGREVEDLAAIIEEVGGPAALYTSSSGATVALAAVDAGVDVSALALYEPPFFAGRDMTDHLTEIRRLVAAGDNDAAMRYNLTSVIGLPVEAVDGMAQAPWWPAMTAVAPTLLHDFVPVHEINAGPDWSKRWASITVPVVVYSGDRTFPGLAEAADATAAALPDARRRVLAGQGHGPAAELIVPELLEFLR